MSTVSTLNKHTICAMPHNQARSAVLVIAILIIFATVGVVRAQSSIHVIVLSLENRPVSGIAFNVKGSNITSARTDRSGRVQIKLPAKSLPGETICLKLLRAPKNMLILAPLDGCAVVPSPKSASPVTIILSMRGDSNLLANELEKRKKNFADAALNVAQRSYSLGKYEDAAKSYQEVLAIRKDDPEALEGLGQALTRTGDYKEAESVLTRSLQINTKNAGENHPTVAKTLVNLADLYRQQGRTDEAQVFYRRAATILQKTLGPEDPLLAMTLNSLGALFADKGDYYQAQAMYEQAITILQKAQLADSADMAYVVNNLANVYDIRGDLRHAEDLYAQSLSIFRKTLGVEHPQVALLLDNIGALYVRTGDYSKAELFLSQGLSIREKMADEVAISYSLNNIAVLYLKQKNYERAEPYLVRALAILERAFGSDNPNVSYLLGNLGDLYSIKGDYSRAEPLYLRALEIVRRTLGPAASVAVMKRLAKLYKNKGDYVKAEPLYGEILKTEEGFLGNSNPVLASTLDDYAELLSKMNRLDEASRLTNRANRIRIKDQNDTVAVEILDPARDGMQVPGKSTIKGKATIVPDSHLWVLIRRSDFKDVWWPQAEAQIDPKTGLWEVPVAFGTASDVGHEFEISVVLVNKTDHESLLSYREQAARTGIWNPIQPPSSLTMPRVRKVVRSK